MVTLGCSKNLYDSEVLTGQLRAGRKEVVHEQHGDIVVINTCGFIANAKEESINTILEYVKLKNEGEVEKVFSNIPGELISRSDLKHLLKEPGNSYIETLYPDYCFLLEQNHIIYPKHLQAELKGYHGGLTEEELKIPIIEIHNF